MRIDRVQIHGLSSICDIWRTLYQGTLEIFVGGGILKIFIFFPPWLEILHHPNAGVMQLQVTSVVLESSCYSHELSTHY